MGLTVALGTVLTGGASADTTAVAPAPPVAVSASDPASAPIQPRRPRRPRLPTPPAPPDAPAPAPAGPDFGSGPQPTPAGQASLAVGITEPNPSLIWPAGEKSVPPAFAPWRDATGAVRPHYYRLQLDWAELQPRSGLAPDFDRTQAGCMRDRLPCAPWQGLREQLRALTARQAEGGWETVVSISGTPAWAARPPGGCEREGTGSRSRAPRPDAIPAYRQLIQDVIAAADGAGARLRWWNAWNEPNHPYFLSPQRLECDVTAPTESVDVYLELHDALG